MTAMKTDSKKKSILFVHYGEEWIRGSERCLINLLKYLDKTQYRPIVWCNSKAMEAQIQALGLTVIRSQFNVLLGWQKPKFSFISWLKQTRRGIHLIRQYNIDLVHVNSGAPNQWMLPATRITKRPLVTHLHSPYLFRDRLSLALYQAPNLVGVSHGVVSDFIKDGMPRHNVQVIHNGIDINHLQGVKPFAIKKKIGLSESDFLLASVGSLIHRKGLDLLINAISKLHHRGTRAYLIIMGDGPERAQLEQQVNNLKLDKYILFWGECQCTQEILSGGVDLVVSAAREEAFGLSVAEAGIAKLPVAAPDIAGINEVVAHKQTGLLFQSENVDSMVETISYFHSNPQASNTMGNAAYDHICLKFSIQQNVQQFTQLYQSCIQQQSTDKSKGNPQFILALMLFVKTGKLFATKTIEVIKSHLKPAKWARNSNV